MHEKVNDNLSSKYSEDNGISREIVEASVENSEENSSFIRNLMQRRNLSPSNRNNPEINV
jgi:hypothetical protein